MRISSKENDWGKPVWDFLVTQGYRDIQVLVNGIAQCHVITADEELGYVDKVMLDDRGNPWVEPRLMMNIAERVRGDVKIVIPEASIPIGYRHLAPKANRKARRAMKARQRGVPV